MSAPSPIPRPMPSRNAETPAHTAQLSCAGCRFAAGALLAMEAAGRISSDDVKIVRMKAVLKNL